MPFLFGFIWFDLICSGLTTASSALSQQVAVTGTATSRVKGLAAQDPSETQPRFYFSWIQKTFTEPLQPAGPSAHPPDQSTLLFLFKRQTI